MAKTRDKLIPYLDLFDRLDDEELSRIAGVEVGTVSDVRTVVESIYDPLREYEKLLPTLDDRQLCKLFGFPESAAAIWRHCRAPQTIEAEKRQSEGLFDDMMGSDDDDDDDDDLLIVLDEDTPESDGPPAVDVDDGWADL